MNFGTVEVKPVVTNPYNTRVVVDRDLNHILNLPPENLVTAQEIKFYTKNFMCELRGSCPGAAACLYSHDSQERVDAFRKASWCHSVKKHKRCKSNTCAFAHNNKEKINESYSTLKDRAHKVAAWISESGPFEWKNMPGMYSYELKFEGQEDDQQPLVLSRSTTSDSLSSLESGTTDSSVSLETQFLVETVLKDSGVEATPRTVSRGLGQIEGEYDDIEALTPQESYELDQTQRAMAFDWYPNFQDFDEFKRYVAGLEDVLGQYQ